MADGRMLKRAISGSKKFAALRRDKARLLYLLMLPWTDVEGRIEADSALIKGQMVTLLRYSLELIEECLTDLEAVGLIVLYEADGRRILQFTRFEDFQNLRKDREKASEFSAPPEYAGSTPGVRRPNISEVKLIQSNLIREGFECFWQKWKGRWNGERHIKVGKDEAEQVWADLTEEERIKAIKHAAQATEKFTPNAAKWLMLKRFRDYEKTGGSQCG